MELQDLVVEIKRKQPIMVSIIDIVLHQMFMTLVTWLLMFILLVLLVLFNKDINWKESIIYWIGFLNSPRSPL